MFQHLYQLCVVKTEFVIIYTLHIMHKTFNISHASKKKKSSYNNKAGNKLSIRKSMSNCTTEVYQRRPKQVQISEVQFSLSLLILL